MQKMINALKTFRTQSPALIFSPPLSPPSNVVRKASGVSFKQVTTSSAQSTVQKSSEDHNNMQKPQDKETEKTGDILSYGEGYATRCDDDGFGEIYGGNESIPNTNPQDHLIHENHPAYDKSQGSEVKEKEKGRHQSDASA